MAKILHERLTVEPSVFATLQVESGLNRVAVYNALAFRSNSEKAKAIRERAKELGAATTRTFISK